MVQALHNRAAKWWVRVGFTIMTFLLLGAGGQWIGLLGTWFLDSSAIKHCGGRGDKRKLNLPQLYPL
ncbi:uncharacterized protein K441DRAFT_254270 [Cenococcum geophilum 1.58]|uniref:uncharacterized protein n=1 Tax=Cenococcum geophilum 1.58 TaxID=794803 RepID=UPI00359029B2|nr:hypothetical protein K441DRAFT_254270 [Cenococcum geophilum 1.58]